jgi:hypothetical protein
VPNAPGYVQHQGRRSVSVRDLRAEASRNLLTVLDVALPQRVTPTFATAADAEHFSYGLMPLNEIPQGQSQTQASSRARQLYIDGAAASWGDYAVVLPSQLTRQTVVQPMFATAADAEFAARTQEPESARR